MKIPRFILNQLVTLKAYKGTDSSGAPVYDSISTIDPDCIISYDDSSKEYVVRGRFEPVEATKRNTMESDAEFRGTFFTLGTHVPPQSVLIFEGNKYIVTDCIKQYGLNSISHIEVTLQ